jgi:hypothetical protein
MRQIRSVHALKRLVGSGDAAQKLVDSFLTGFLLAQVMLQQGASNEPLLFVQSSRKLVLDAHKLKKHQALVQRKRRYLRYKHDVIIKLLDQWRMHILREHQAVVPRGILQAYVKQQSLSFDIGRLLHDICVRYPLSDAANQSEEKTFIRDRQRLQGFRARGRLGKKAA